MSVIRGGALVGEFGCVPKAHIESCERDCEEHVLHMDNLQVARTAVRPSLVGVSRAVNAWPVA